MQSIKTGDLVLGLSDLLKNKLGLIASLLTFQLYGKALEEKLTILSEVVRGLGETPLVKQLTVTDAVHDTAGRLVHHLCTGLAGFVEISAADRAFFQEVKKTFVPNRGFASLSYQDEAAAATERIKKLAPMKERLASHKLPLGLTLYSVLSTYLEAGVHLGELLSERADKEVRTESARTKKLHVIRVETISLLYRFRETLVQEVEANPTLPRDLEAQVFAYIDKLAENREDARKPGNDEEADSETPETDAAAANA